MNLVGVVTLLLYLVLGLEATLGSRRLKTLEQIEPISDREAPRVSVVVPALNEERSIEQAMRSVLAQDYPGLEVIAVDDRSTDRTGAILDRLAEEDGRLRVLHIESLPAGWLGKNHALYAGARTASGEVLLFTDADVKMELSTVRRAVNYLQQEKLDHLAVPPLATVGGFFSNSFLAAFALLFSLYSKPWKVRDPKAREFIGIGAFNMVRASAYWAVDGHKPISLRPDDDMRLGRLLKRRGFVQDVLFGTKFVHVEWYATFGEMRRGLMKNLFAGAEYKVAYVAASIVFQLVCLVWPFVGLVLLRGTGQAINAAIVATLMGLFWVNSRKIGVKWYWCLTMPLAGLVSIYLITRATALTLWRGGIEWRGTKYRLAELRSQVGD